MKLEEWVNLHKDCGFDINSNQGFHYLFKNRILYSFPELVPVPVDKKLIRKLQWRYPITVVKTGHRIKNTYEYILDTNNYSFDTFRKKTRTTIRKSLNSCEFKKPLIEDLVHYGLKINRQTLHIQDRNDKCLTDPEMWKKYISLCYDHEDVKILAAYLGNVMIGYAMAFRLGEMHYFHLQHIDREYATYYPMSGLMYILINQLIEQYGRIRISDGVESFDSIPSLNRFKRYMGFERIPITRVYIINPLIVMMLYPFVYVYVSLMHKRNSQNTLMRKMINLYYGHRVLHRIAV